MSTLEYVIDGRGRQTALCGEHEDVMEEVSDIARYSGSLDTVAALALGPEA